MDTSKTLYRCYIDESGDEGLTPKSRPFFFVTAVVFEDTIKPDLLNTIDTIKKRIYPSNGVVADIHWQKLKHPQRIVCVREIAKHPIYVISVGIWKPKLIYMKNREQLYNTAIHYLVQRISWLVNELDGYTKITFSDRSNLRGDVIRSFIASILTAPNSQIRPVFNPDDIEIVKAAKQPMLQIADACAGAIANAFNSDNYSETHPHFMYEICKRLYRSKGGKLMGYGLKIFPDKEFADCQGKDFQFMEVIDLLIRTEK